MKHLILGCAALFLLAGCADRMSSQVGAKPDVPVDTVRLYSQQHGISEAAARERIQEEINAAKAAAAPPLEQAN